MEFVVARLNLNEIEDQLDFEALQENIDAVANCSITDEVDQRAMDPNFSKLFKLAQMIIQYLLYSQDYLVNLNTEIEEKISETEKVCYPY